MWFLQISCLEGFKNGIEAIPIVIDNRFGMNYVEINVGSLNCFEDGTVVEPVMLIEHGMIKNIRDGVRILGNGELTKKLTVQAMGFSKSAEEKIIAAGGKVEVI